MPIINYAIEIFTASTLEDVFPEYGFYDGYFRFITGRPRYDGATVTPHYGANEINAMNGESLSGEPIITPFYEGFLQKQGITGNPARSIDISTAGSYSTDSSFQFTLRNDMKFWNFLQDPLNTGSYDGTNAINLTGCLVVMWVVIDDVFYQIARGKITNNPYTETDYNFCVEDDATTIHKNIPPQISTYMGLLDGVVQREQGAVVPVVFGNVPYSPLMRNDAVNDILKLNGDYYPAAAMYYNVDTSSIPYVYNITLVVSVPDFVANDPRLVGKYLSVLGGDGPGSSSPIDSTNRYYKIIGSSVSAGTGPNYPVVLTLADPILVSSGSDGDSVLTQSTFNVLANGCIINGVSGVATSHTWWFQITNLATSANVSQNPVVVDGVYSYNSNINNYDNESAALQLSSTPKSTVDLIANTVGLDGSVDMFERINLPMVNLGFAYDGLGGHSEVYDTTTPDGIAAIAAVTDQDRTTGKAFTHQYTGGPAASDLQIFATYKPQSINPSILNQVLTESYANLYFVVDFSLAPQSPLTGPIPFIPWNRSYLTSVAWQTTDITGCIMNGSTMPSDIPTDSSLGPYNTLPELGGSVSNINFLQNNLVKSNYGLNSISLFDRQSTTAGKTYKAIFKITDLAPRSIFMRPEITEIKLMFNFNSNYGSSGGIIYSAILTINEIAVIGERSVNILTGNIFASTTGETIASDGATFANTVYKSFQHIMEDYDGIPNAMIDYGDLPESRDEGEEPGWPVSRTLTEQKNSRDYLNELCQHSFVAMFSGRTGMRTLRALSDGTGSLSAKWTHNGSNIVAGTLGDYAKTDVSSLFNCFYLQYAYDPGSQQYIRGFNVNSLLIGYTSDGVTPWEFPDAATPDPDGSGNPYWWAFFSGLQVSATDPSVGHDDAASIWNLCQAAYLQNRCSKPVQGDISELPWFTDSLIYDSSDSSGSGVTSPAYMLLKMLATWATTQKETVSYCIPITATTIATEMIDIVAFYDNLITNAKERDGWITGIEYDCNNDQIKITLTLQPLELVGA